MKKLLAILSAITLTGSAATSVVACGTDPRVNPETNDGNKDNSGDDDNGKQTKPPGWIKDETKKPDGGDKDDNKPKPPVQNPTRNDEVNIKAAFDAVAQRSVYENQYNFDRNYLNQQLQLFNGTLSGLQTEKGVVDNPNTITTSNLIDGYIANDISSNNAKLDGVRGSKTKLPAVDALPVNLKGLGLPDSIANLNLHDLVPKIMSFLNGPYMVDSTSILSLVSILLNLLGINSIAEKVSSYKDGVTKVVDPILKNSDVQKFVNNIGENSISRFENLTLNDVQKSIIIGVYWILLIGVDSNDKNIQKYQDIEKIGNFNDATNDFADLIGRLKNKKVSLNANNYKNFLEDTKGNLNYTNLGYLVTNGYGMINLLSCYLQAFSEYKIENPKDANHIFSNTQTNWEIINSVKSKTIKDANLDFNLNIHALSSDLAYYLGDLDNDKGIYRLQALFAILFQDKDYSNRQHIFDWDDSKNKELSVDKNTPLMTLAIKIIVNVANIDAIIPGWLSLLLPILGFPSKLNNTVAQLIYQAFQSFSTRKSIVFSDYETGWIIKTQSGTKKILGYINSDFLNQVFKDPLDFIYNGDIANWLGALPDNLKSWASIGSELAKTALNPIVKNLQNIVGAGNKFNLKTLAGFPLKDILALTNTGLFNKNVHRLEPEFGSFYTNKSLPQLVNYLATDVFNVGKYDKRSDLKQYDIDISQISQWSNIIWFNDLNNKPTNIVDEFFRIISIDNSTERIKQLKSLLGIMGPNLYDTKKILGKLLITLVPDLTVDKDNGYVKGDYRKSSPLINTLINYLNKFYNDINKPTNYDDALDKLLSEDKANNALINNAISNDSGDYLQIEKKDGVITKVSKTMSYTWTSPDQTKHVTNYKFVMSRKTVTDLFQYQVEKIGDTNNIYLLDSLITNPNIELKKNASTDDFLNALKTANPKLTNLDQIDASDYDGVKTSVNIQPVKDSRVYYLVDSTKPLKITIKFS